MKYELIEIDVRNEISDYFPDFFDDCNPTSDDCMPNDIPELRSGSNIN